MRDTAPTRIVGTPVLRKEGFGKVTGGALYIDDINLPGMWHGATVRSSIARGTIKEIRFGGGIAWDEFVIVTAKDIPGENCIPLIVDHDQPVLADKRVNHPEEPIVLLAHPDKARLHEGVAAVEIDYDPLPAVFTIEESERQQTIVWGEDNCIKRYLVEKGDVNSAWQSAAHIVTGEYRTGAQEQLYIENNGVIAEWSEAGGITIQGSMQCPYYVHKALLRVFDLPAEKVRVIQVETGGAFGGKEDYPSLIAAHAACWRDNLATRSKLFTTGKKTCPRLPSVIRRARVSALPWIKTGACRRWTSRWTWTAARMPRLRRRYFRVRRFMPLARTIAKTSECARKRGQRICRRTAPFADSAHHRRSLALSGTWTRLRKLSGFLRKKYAAGIFSRKAKRQPLAS